MNIIQLIFRYFKPRDTSAHSAYSYHLYKLELQKLDKDYHVRDRVISGELNSSVIKDIFFDRMEREGKMICIYCQRPLKRFKGLNTNQIPENKATIEHIVPISEGGLKYAESNFACACYFCNNARGVYPIYKVSETEYVYKLKFYAKAKKDLVVSKNSPIFALSN